jgi:hypothetical protein
VEYRGQNGKKRVQRVRPKTACGKHKRHAHRRKGHKHRSARRRA